MKHEYPYPSYDNSGDKDVNDGCLFSWLAALVRFMRKMEVVRWIA